VVLLVFALQTKGLYQKYPHLLHVFNQLILCFFPLLFLQVTYLITRHKVFENKDLIHFVPFLSGIVLYMVFFIRSIEEKLAIHSNPPAYYQIVEIILYEIISLQGIIYSNPAILLIRKYQKDQVFYFHDA
jgi:hypothetical protein